MKAIVYTEYGPPDVLQLKRWKSLLPGIMKYLIRNHATTVNIGDLWARNFKEITPRKFTMPLPLLALPRDVFWIHKTKNKYPGE